MIDADLDSAVKAVLSRKDALIIRDAAYVRLVRKGWSTLRIEREMRQRLLAEGLSDKDLRNQGVSHDAVRHALVAASVSDSD
jgi:hypothetical protein